MQRGTYIFIGQTEIKKCKVLKTSCQYIGFWQSNGANQISKTPNDANQQELVLEHRKAKAEIQAFELKWTKCFPHCEGFSCSKAGLHTMQSNQNYN